MRTRFSSETSVRDDLVLVWGVSSCVGFWAAQLALLAGCRVIGVACEAKHGNRLRKAGISECVPSRLFCWADRKVQLMLLTATRLLSLLPKFASFPTTGFAKQSIV
jgi:NADPH:quinone reductase-like Zn-dependent oxidoreductase